MTLVCVRRLLPLALLATACPTRPVEEMPDDDAGSTSPSDGEDTVATPPPADTGTTAVGDDTMDGIPPSETAAATESTESTGAAGAGEGEECDLESHDPGCAPGLKCIPYSPTGAAFEWAAACFPIDPAAVDLYEPCQWYGDPWSGYDNCGDQAFCEDFDSDGVGICKGLCQFAPGNDWDDIECEDRAADPGVACQSCFCTCEATCHPLDAMACPEGMACYAVGGFPDFQCAADASGEQGTYGDSCEYINVCDAGHFCASNVAVPGCTESSGCCTPFCDLTEPNTCPGAGDGQECLPWYGDPRSAPEGFENLGGCSLPR